MILPFESVDEILQFDKYIYEGMQLSGTFLWYCFHAVQDGSLFESVDEAVKCDHS